MEPFNLVSLNFFFLSSHGLVININVPFNQKKKINKQLRINETKNQASYFKSSKMWTLQVIRNKNSLASPFLRHSIFSGHTSVGLIGLDFGAVETTRHRLPQNSICYKSKSISGASQSVQKRIQCDSKDHVSFCNDKILKTYRECQRDYTL